ncbi:tetratricopeptide repeat (TPR)-like superfamily protein [Tasmannia lanceolata]|uniref:tetratricopeptide repeat (TPR)-like superfamily protein n=1 Tax=Tasmannia lanceolata TaxID=3420 RepID=UPI004063E40B
MRISEISLEIRSSESESQSLLLKEIEDSIKEAERLTPEDLSPGKLSGKLQKSLSRLNSFLPLPESGNLQIWKLSYRLWNACVDLSNNIEISFRNEEKANLRSKIDEEQANLRQISADLLFLAGNVTGIPSPAFKSASFFYRTGLMWHDLKKFDLASNCYERATDLLSKIEIDDISDCEERKLLLDLNLSRSRTAWEVSERNLALTVLNRSKNLLFGNPENYRALAEQYLEFGKFVLSRDDKSAINEALKLINEALDQCEKGLGLASEGGYNETLTLKNLRAKSLRFLAAAHLQMEEFERVLKCVRVLRDTCGADHTSVPFLAMKAWLGLGRVVEAEKELRSMVVNKGVPEGICVSALEAFFQGAGVAGADATKGIFLGMLGRCHVSAGTAVRVVQKILAGGNVSVVAEIVSDEKVVALFAGGGAKERSAMHALLWNSGAEHFRSKDYETSAEVFEKSMLYVPHDVENRILRAKCFRVLCLCHLGLSQLDRAEEYINEAEKLEPNVACAFLKFKIYLQKKDEKGAINQMQTMVSCIDFNPEFIILSAHEAMACRALPVAIASISNLLNLYSPGKLMPMPEVALLRNLIALLFQNPNNESEILKQMKRAKTRMSELGTEQFFGKGAVGSRELSWFAGDSWNMGIKTARENKYEFCAEFWEMASDFYGVMEETDANRAMVCKSLVICVAAMINGEKQMGVSLTDSDVRRGLELVDRAGKILSSFSTAAQLVENQPAIQPSFYFLHTFSAYDLHGRLDEARSQQLLLIKNFASSRTCTPQNLLHMGLTASRAPRPNPEAAHFALNACLTALLAAPSPNYQTVALAIRKLITLAGFRQGDSDDEAYSVYRQAYRIMVGLKEGEYPVEEGKWLATTCWNRSVLPGRLGQTEVAIKWMKMGLELARHLPGMDGCRDCMEKCLASVEKVGEEMSESRHHQLVS